MTKVYVCSEHDYESSTIVAAYDDEAKANTAAERMGWGVQEVEVNASDPATWPPGRPFLLTVRVDVEKSKAQPRQQYSPIDATWANEQNDTTVRDTEWSVEKTHKAFTQYTRYMWATTAASAFAEAKMKQATLILMRDAGGG